MVVTAVWGTEELIHFHAALYIKHKDEMKKRVTRRAAWILRKNGWSSGSHHTTPPLFQNGWFFQKLFFKSSLLLDGYSATFKYLFQTAATTFAFSFVWFLFIGRKSNWGLSVKGSNIYNLPNVKLN